VAVGGKGGRKRGRPKSAQRASAPAKRAAVAGSEEEVHLGLLYLACFKPVGFGANAVVGCNGRHASTARGRCCRRCSSLHTRRLRLYPVRCSDSCLPALHMSSGAERCHVTWRRTGRLRRLQAEVAAGVAGQAPRGVRPGVPTALCHQATTRCVPT